MSDHTHPGSGSCTLDDWRVMAIEGPDAASFLQGQLTQDVASLGPDAARLGGYCSAKGRLMATGVLWRPAPERLLWAVPAELLPGLLKRLQMFVMRAKVRLSETELRLTGIADQATDLPVWGSTATPDGSLTRLPDALGRTRLLQIGTAASANDLPRAAWDWLELHAGQPWVHAATAEHFVPQMLNWELLGGVNFQKGCYPGQEVVARSQFRGTLKRRAFVLHSAEPLTAGQEVFHSADAEQACGTVALAAPAPTGGWDALASLTIASTHNGSLHAGAASGPTLRLGTLPYALLDDI